MIEEAVRSGSGHIAIQHPDFLAQKRSEQVFNGQELSNFCKEQNNVQLVLPRIQLAGIARSSRENCSAMVSGVDFAVESQVNQMLSKKNNTIGTLPGPDKKNQAYIGAALAERLRLKVGQKLVFMFQDFEGIITSKLFRISGTFTSGLKKIDSSLIFVDRQELAESFAGKNMVHELALLVENKSQIPTTMNRISEFINSKKIKDATVLDWQHSMKQLSDAIKFDHANLKFMIFLLFALVAIGTVNLILMSVLERTREFGLLRALGLQKKKIRILIATEALFLGVIGSATGLGLGIAASYYTWKQGLDFTFVFEAQEFAGIMFEPVIKSGWSYGWMAGLTACMILIVMAASIYPAGKAMRTKPAEAMRKY
jgi:ABC-type lipoprotein release transport system permease subunit